MWISVAPNLAGDDAIMIVSGLHTESSEGAPDAALPLGFLEHLNRGTGMAKGEDPIDVEVSIEVLIEVLIEVRGVDGSVRVTRLPASRKHMRG